MRAHVRRADGFCAARAGAAAAADPRQAASPPPLARTACAASSAESYRLGRSMLGARLKSWVEAQLGRARRRKHKSSPARAPPRLTPSAHVAPLSSPESAYSTGYSTDGTSPGAPPEPRAPPPAPRPPPPHRPVPAPPPPPVHHIYHEPVKRRASCGHHRSESSGWCRTGPPVPAPPPVVRTDASATPSPRPRCRIRTNPWLSAAPSPAPPRRSNRAPFSPLSHLASPTQHRIQHVRCCRNRGGGAGASSDEECRGACGRETAILSDAEVDTDADTGLDGGDERDPEDELDSPASRRRARRRRPPQRRQAPRSAGATPPRARRTRAAPITFINPCPPPPPTDPLLEADREAERKYRSLIREAERLLVSVSRAPPPLEPPHNPRVRLLRAEEAEPHRMPSTSQPRSPERTHLTNFIRANSPPAEAARRESPLARVPPPAPPPRLAPANPQPPPPPQSQPAPADRPHSEPPKRKSYTQNLMLVQTLEGLKRSLEQQSALLASQTHAHCAPPSFPAHARIRLDSL